MADETEYLNRFINCVDPAKDAIPSFQGKHLTVGDHGLFLKKTIGELFNSKDLRESDQKEVVGLGDKKMALKARIEGALKLNDYKPIPIVRLSFSSSGLDLRVKGYSLAQDAGPGLHKISSDYTLVLTPASILDSAGKQKKHSSILDGTKNSSKLTETLLKKYDFSHILTSIEFNGSSSFSFDVTTRIPSHLNMTFSFSKKTYKETTTDYFEGNRIKNKYIYDNWKDDSKLPNIQMFILVKELQDTFQAAWLEVLYKDVDTLALCTNDINMWLRCMVNSVPCILSHGVQTSYYPVATTDAQRAIRKKVAMESLYKELRDNNNDVIDNMKGFYKLLSETKAEDITLTNNHDIYFSENHRAFIKFILYSVINHIEVVASDILKRAPQIIQDIDESKLYVEKHMMKYPFLVNIPKKHVRFLTGFTSFFPNANMKIRFNSTLLLGKLMNGKNFVENDIEPVLANIPILNVAAGTAMYGGNPTPSPRKPKETYAELQEIISKNIMNTGFFMYFILNYLPEIPYIGYAYAVATGYPTAKFDRLFDSTVCESMCDLFGRMSSDSIFDYNITSLVQYHIETESRMVELCMIAIAAYEQKGDTFTIFDHAYDEIHFFLQFWRHHAAGWKGTITENDHGTALEVYQVLYEAEISLTLLNMRDSVSPIEYANAANSASHSIKKSTRMSTPSPKSMGMSTPSPKSTRMSTPSPKSMGMSTPSPKSMGMSTPSSKKKSRSKSRSKSKSMGISRVSSKKKSKTRKTKGRKRLIHSKPRYMTKIQTRIKRKSVSARE